jgi:hypothetical protein
MCVEAEYELKTGGLLNLLISLDELQKAELGGSPKVKATVIGAAGEVRQVHSLGDLPMELHRGLPPRPTMPRDLPAPARDS